MGESCQVECQISKKDADFCRGTILRGCRTVRFPWRDRKPGTGKERFFAGGCFVSKAPSSTHPKTGKTGINREGTTFDSKVVPPRSLRKPALDGAWVKFSKLNASEAKETSNMGLSGDVPTKDENIAAAEHSLERQHSNGKQVVRNKAAMPTPNVKTLLLFSTLPFLFGDLAFNLVLSLQEKPKGGFLEGAGERLGVKTFYPQKLRSLAVYWHGG